MATKQEKAIKNAVTREKKKGILREEKHVLWLLIAIILVLLYLLFAQHNGWWPYSRPKLGTAFFTNVSSETPAPASSGSTSSDGTSDDSSNNDTSGSGSTTTGGGTSGGGSSTGGGSNTGGGNTGGGTTTPEDADSILDLAGVINIGNTKTQVSSKANNLGEHCAVIVNAVAQNVGKQEVCTYSQGDKIVTVTYLNDRVISASKSGF